MTQAAVLLTVCALLTVACFLLARQTKQYAADAMASERALRKRIHEIDALAVHVEVLSGQLRKLNGRVSAQRRWDARDERDEPYEPDDVFTPPLQFGQPCVNWRTQAYPQGDNCPYCTGMRAERQRTLDGANLPGARKAQ